MARLTKRQSALRRVLAQQAWMAERGTTLAGYVATYGSGREVDAYGDGAEAIYAADLAELHRAEQALAGCR